MSWEDDNFGSEFIKFRQTVKMDNFFSTVSPNHFVIYIKPIYDSIVDYENAWRKKRKKIRVREIILAQKEELSDDISRNENLWLDMGARLFNCLKEHAIKKTKYLVITKSINPLDKFDTWYEAKEYKIKKVGKIKPNPKSKQTSK